MIVRLGRQAFGGVISAFALLGFVFVPLGERTGFEHAKAILATREAERAARGLVAQLEAVKERLFASTEGKSLAPTGNRVLAPAKPTREISNASSAPTGTRPHGMR